MTEPMDVDREREAMEWLDAVVRHNTLGPVHIARTLKRMLANYLPARLYEEDAVAIAEAVRRDHWHISGGDIQVIWHAIYAHLSASPKPPTPKTCTVFVVRASWSEPEARVKVSEWDSTQQAAMEARQFLHKGATVAITPEERPCKS